MKPLVSIILPIYKVEKYLKQCLISIQNQTYTNFEVICINDGSPDNSEQIFYETVNNDSRFTLYNQSNRGIAYVRNLGVQLCQGELITFVDSDDTIQPNYLEVLVNGIIDHNCDISVGGHTMMFPKLRIPIHVPASKVLSQKKALSYIIRDFLIMNYSWGKCYKKEVWKDVIFPENETYEDVQTIYKTFLNANKVYVSHQSIYNYTIRTGSITQTQDRNKILKQAYISQMNTVSQKYPSLKIFGTINCMKANLMILYDQIK